MNTASLNSYCDKKGQTVSGYMYKDISLLKNESLIRIENLTNGAFTLHSQTY